MSALAVWGLADAGVGALKSRSKRLDGGAAGAVVGVGPGGAAPAVEAGVAPVGLEVVRGGTGAAVGAGAE